MSRICLSLCLSALAILSFSSCQETISFDEQQEIDRAIIEEYVAVNNLDGQYTEQGIFYAITKEGVGTETPNMFSTILIDYVGTLLDGTQFDSSNGFPREFQLGTLIRGWQIGLEQFKAESKGILIIPSRFAYRETGSIDGSIGPNTVIRFDIELVEFY
ncbi:MAG: FKBP-type peptidyl-prolyl cis-trans isomerase [Bacteroidota bacterium]